MIRKVLRLSANTVLSVFGLSIIRNYEREYVREKYLDLITELQSFFKEKIFKDFPIDKKRTKLFAQLYGTQVSEAFYIIYYLNKTLQLKGDVCEFGCANGATSALLAHEIKKTNKNLWLFDSFQGLSKPAKEDRLINDIFHLGSMNKYEGSMKYSVGEVKSRLRAIAFPERRTKIVSGFIEQTITQKELPAKISFAFVDFDLYTPIKTALKYIDVHLVKRGVVIIDDYNFFSLGAKKAVDEFYTTYRNKYNLFFPHKSAGHFCILQKK